MGREFAVEYPRDEHGWVKFPSDVQYRDSIFPPETNSHPAKANVFLVQSIIEYVSDTGQTLMDIMAGTGTLMIGALMGRDIICVEISPHFHEIQKMSMVRLEDIAPGISDHISLVNMPCQLYLPIPNLVDHIIFSPQYANILVKGKTIDKLTREKFGAYNFAEYSNQPLNLGTMNDWLWIQEMGKIYSKCFQTIKPGGTLTVIVKDHYRDGKRVELSKAAQKSCTQIGFRFNPTEWFKWDAPGMFYNITKSKGFEAVKEEDIVVLRKP